MSLDELQERIAGVKLKVSGANASICETRESVRHLRQMQRDSLSASVSASAALTAVLQGSRNAWCVTSDGSATSHENVVPPTLEVSGKVSCNVNAARLLESSHDTQHECIVLDDNSSLGGQWGGCTTRGEDNIAIGLTLANDVPYLQREYDDVVRAVLTDRAWSARLTSVEPISILLAMLAIHAEYLAAILVTDWANEQSRFSSWRVTTLGLTSMVAIAGDRGRGVPPPPTGPLPCKVPPNRPGECWAAGGRTKKERAKVDCIQGLCEHDLWDDLGGTPSDVKHARAATIVASILNPIRLSLSGCGNNSQQELLQWIAEDTGRWDVLGALGGAPNSVVAVFRTDPQHTFRSMTRSPEFTAAAARVQEHSSLSEDVVNAACWLLDSARFAQKPLSLAVCITVVDPDQ